jgi:hypothetical protein
MHYLIIEFRGGILEGKQEDFSSVLSVHGKQRGRERAACGFARSRGRHGLMFSFC